ncbi:MAG: hypothetical protein ABI243_01715, partial [Lapillicoccus sp.]
FAKGADPEVLDASATRLTEFGEQCTEIRGAVATLFGTVTKQWSGPDSRHYATQAPVVDGRLASCAQTLTALGAKLRSNADAQRHASGGGGASGATGAPVYLPAGYGPGGGGNGGPPGTGGPGGGGAPPATSTGSSYAVGPPKKPDFTWDEDFAYDSKDGGFGDWLDKQKWMAKTEGAKIVRPDLDDALTAYEHYWDNNGEPLEIDYEEAYREDPHVRTNVNNEVARTAAAVDELVRSGQTSFSVSGPGHASDAYPTTENWQKTVGAYQQWSSADVTVENGVVTMKVTVHAEDHYNFNRGQSDIGSGAPDDENGRFTEIGWAKPFDTHGEVVRTVTWKVGDPPPSMDFGSGDENRNPGREDRTDNRDNPNTRPGSDRDTGGAGSNR